MKSAVLLSVAILFLLVQAVPQEKNPILVDRVGDTGFIHLQAESFRALEPRQQQLAYWLTQASIAIDPIIYDQLSRFGLQQKRLLEEIVGHPQSIDPKVMGRITDFAKLFWANRGNHNEMTAQKFLPAFTFDELRQAALTAQKNGALKTSYADLPPLPTPAVLDRELEQLRPAFFDANFEPMITAKSPQGGKDIIQAGSNTFYQGVTLADLKDFHGQHPLNSRVIKGPDGKLREEVYRAGTPDGKILPGLYATYLKKAIACLEKARAAADLQQAIVISALIRFYQTGDFNDWLKFGSAWVQNNATVDFANGFIEIYRDANGMKGSSQSFVSITDKPVSDAMAKLAQNAAYFEEKAPWDAKYKKQAFKAPVVKAVETLIETGDFQVSTIGDNLPNENEIHEKYGTKNFLFTASSRALNDAAGSKSIEEFGSGPEVIERAKKYGDQADDLMTAMHEVIGHGSGKLSDRLKGGSEPYLKEYFSTLEEARADLMALWNAWDPKLKDLGLVPNQEEEARSMYDTAALVVLTQLRRIPRGATIEEDHQRDRALIANYIMDKTGAIAMIDRNGKTYVQVKDYQKMREGVGRLLAELMRIKAEGDYSAIKALVDKYGVHFNPALRDQVVARFKKLDLPTYWAGINPELTAEIDAGGRVTKVQIRYPRNAVNQYLNYAAMYDRALERK
ncbi:MAG: dipeptidyl peptidase 3 [Acidobacteriia bacterium]|nr:dipeptidyl peptidase 3 [Terriglobia bacterium]